MDLLFVIVYEGCGIGSIRKKQYEIDSTRKFITFLSFIFHQCGIDSMN